MTYLSLFSGIGGKDLGLDQAGMCCVGQVEIDEFCNLVLEKHWPSVPRWRDINGFTKREFEYLWTLRGKKAPTPDLICGGFPCQDISLAGKGAGITGTKSGLWKQMFRVIQSFRPRWLLVENVAALKSRGADTVLSDLDSLAYQTWPIVVGAYAVGLPQERQRAWLVAYSMQKRFQNGRHISIGTEQIISLPPRSRMYSSWPASRNQQQHKGEKSMLVELGMGGAINGIPSRLVRLNNAHAIAAYGNAAVPELVQAIGEVIVAKDLELQNMGF
jgi:DNA (cytosine-5)-methyltransferase 1